MLCCKTHTKRYLKWNPRAKCNSKDTSLLYNPSDMAWRKMVSHGNQCVPYTLINAHSTNSNPFMDTISFWAYLHRLLPFYIVSSFSINTRRRRTTECTFCLWLVVACRHLRQHDDCWIPISHSCCLPLSFDVNYFETFCSCDVQIKQSLKYETHFQFSEWVHAWMLHWLCASNEITRWKMNFTMMRFSCFHRMSIYSHSAKWIHNIFV